MHFILFIYLFIYCEFERKMKALRKEERKKIFLCTHYFARLTATQINKWINKKDALYVNFCEFERKIKVQKKEITFFCILYELLRIFLEYISKLSLFCDVFTKCAPNIWWTIHNLLWFKISQTKQFTQISITTVSASLIHLQYMTPTWQN